MGRESGIEWTTGTWNPIIGCHKVSPGCRVCYAERLVEGRMGRDFSQVQRASDATFYAPLRWKTPQMIFTCSLSDFFIEEGDPFRSEMWDIIRRTPQHTYQILTKRPERIQVCLPEDWDGGWPNVWLGTSIEMQSYMHRMATLGKVPAKVRFVSAEPLLGPLDFRGYQHGIWFRTVHWVIVGGESDYRNPRPMKFEWAEDIRDQCRAESKAFFFKQVGGRRKCTCHGAWGCCLLGGRTYDEFPEAL